MTFAASGADSCILVRRQQHQTFRKLPLKEVWQWRTFWQWKGRTYGQLIKSEARGVAQVLDELSNPSSLNGFMCIGIPSSYSSLSHSIRFCLSSNTL